jgi:hypothetical protein
MNQQDIEKKLQDMRDSANSLPVSFVGRGPETPDADLDNEHFQATLSDEEYRRVMLRYMARIYRELRHIGNELDEQRRRGR